MSLFPSHNKTNKSIPQNAKRVRWHATDAERAMLVFRWPSAPCFRFSSSTISERKKCLCLNHCCRDVCDCSLWLFWLLAFCSSVTENCLICVTVKRTLSWYSVMQNKWRRRGLGQRGCRPSDSSCGRGGGGLSPESLFHVDISLCVLVEMGWQLLFQL